MDTNKNPFKRKTNDRRREDDFWNDWKENKDINQRRYTNPFEEQMSRIQQFMDHMIKQALQSNPSSSNQEGPFFYGWTYSEGTDREPTFQEFGNLPSQKNNCPLQLSEKQEPYIDIQEEEKEVHVTIEIPGVEKENIDLEVTSTTLSITVDHAERGFQKTIELPSRVQENKSKATYNNGILHIALKKTKQKRNSKNINIE
jgi:HSP20 family protein